MKDKLCKNSLNGQGKAKRLLLFGLSCLFLFFIVGSTQQLHAQEEITVTGEVIDATTEESLPGVSIVIDGTTIGTITDEDGRYSLEVRDPSDVLVFSFMGYETEEIEVGDQRTINVVLTSEITELDETVIIGYGTQRRGDITGSVSSIGEDDFQVGAIRDVAQMIQGQSAGLRVGVTSGDPTANSEIQLRGITTLTGDAQPLVIIDGVPGDLNTLAPEDIESVDVLKDGAAAAIYGTRGSNGVILITTKQAEEGVSTIEYNADIGFQSITREQNFLDAEDYRRLIEEGVDFNDYGYSTDWRDEIMRDNPVNQTHNLLFQGSHEQSDYTASINYREWEGLFNKANNEELRTRLQVNHSMLDDRLRVNASMLTRHQSNFPLSYGYPYRQALIRNPTDRVKEDDGEGWQERDKYFYDNPAGLIEETRGEANTREIRLSGNVIFEPIEDLTMDLLVARNTEDYESRQGETHQHISATQYGQRGTAEKYVSDSEEWIAEFTTEYNFELSNHRFTLLGGYSYKDDSWSNHYLENWDFPTDEFLYENIGAGAALSRGETSLNSYAASSRLVGFFGRANYNYEDKYLLMASLRREGSSRFGEDYRWGVFPAISGGWRISHEDFFPGSMDALFENLMLRVGYGVTGIEPEQPYLHWTTLSYEDWFYYQGEWMQSLEPAQNPNPELRWEEKREYNIGLEASMFNYRVEATFDMYRRHTKDLLWNFSVPVPPFLYGSMMANIGEVENRGMEAHLRFVPIRTDDMEWRTNVGFSTNTNELLDLSDDDFQTEHDFFAAGHTGEPVQEWTHRVRIGGPIGNFWGYKSVDIDEDGRWIIETPEGEHVPIDQTTPEDKQVLGNGIPNYEVSWNHQFSYRQFDLSVSMRGAFDYQILNFDRLFYENPRVTHYNMLESAFDDVYGKRQLNNDLAYVSYYVEDGDYWKIDNITLGYNFDPGAIDWLQRARVYLSVQNALIITGYEGIDPEVSFTGLSPGNDHRDKFPTTRTFTLGMNINF